MCTDPEPNSVGQIDYAARSRDNRHTRLSGLDPATALSPHERFQADQQVAVPKPDPSHRVYIRPAIRFYKSDGFNS